jgi:hypothetical protein
VSIDEALRRLAVAPKTGLEAAQAQRRTAQFGANRISPPPSRTLRKVVGWVFGGFGSLLLAASIVCFIAWYDNLRIYAFGACEFQTTHETWLTGSRWGTLTRKRPTLPLPSSF